MLQSLLGVRYMALKSVPRFYTMVVILLACIFVGWVRLEGSVIFAQSSADAPDASVGVEDSTSLDSGLAEHLFPVITVGQASEAAAPGDTLPLPQPLERYIEEHHVPEFARDAVETWGRTQVEEISAAQAAADNPAVAGTTLLDVLEAAFVEATGEQPLGLFQNLQAAPTTPEGEGAAHGVFSALEVQGEGYAGIQFILPIQFREVDVAPEACPALLAWGYVRFRLSLSPMSFEVSLHIESELDGTHALVMLDSEEEVELSLSISDFPYDYTLSTTEVDLFMGCVDYSPLILAGDGGFPGNIVAATQGPSAESASVCYATLLDEQGGGAPGKQAGFQYFPKTSSLVMTCNVGPSWGIEPTGLSLRGNQDQATVDLGDPSTPYFSYMFSPDEVARLWAPGGFEYVELTYDNGVGPDLALSGVPACYDQGLVGMVIPLDFYLLASLEGEGSPEVDDSLSGRVMLIASPEAFSITMHLDLSEMPAAEAVQARNDNDEVVFSRPVYGETFDHLFQECELLDVTHFVVTTSTQPDGASIGVPRDPEPNGSASYSPGCIVPWDITIENAGQAPVYAQALTVELPRGWSYAGVISSSPPTSEPPLGTTGSFTLIFQEIATFPLNIRLNLMPSGTVEMGQMGTRQVRYRVQSLTELGIADTGTRNITFAPGGSPQPEGEGEGEAGCTAGGGYTTFDAFAPQETTLAVHDFVGEFSTAAQDFLGEFFAVMQNWDNQNNIDIFDFNDVDVWYANIPNGIPDKAEFALIAAILTDPNAPCHDEVYAAFLANRASIYAFISDEMEACYTGPFLDRATVDTLAIYTTLGEDSNWVTNNYLRYMGNMNGCFPTPDISHAQSYPPCVDPDGDIDDDGFTNRREWELLREEQPSAIYSDYLAYVLDPTRPNHPSRVTVTFEVEGQGSISPGVGPFIYYAWQNYQEECLNACEFPGDYPASTCECIPFATEATAIPAEGWLFAGWDTDSGEHEEKSAVTLQFRPIFTQRITAKFIPASDVAELDLVEAALTFFDETVDGNAVSGISSENEPILGGNLIPDISELRLLEYLIKNPYVDLINDYGVSGEEVLEAWRENLALAESRLGEVEDVTPALVAVFAGFMTIGDYGSVERALELVKQEATGETPEDLDTDGYDTSYSRYLGATGDADNDGYSNVEEWVLLGLLPNEPSPPAYVNTALEPNFPRAPDGSPAAQFEQIPVPAPGNVVAPKTQAPKPLCGSDIFQLSVNIGREQPVDSGPQEGEIAIIEVTPPGLTANGEEPEEGVVGHYYYPGTEITVSFRQLDMSHKFARWATNSLPLSGSRSETETFIMPDTPASLTAMFHRGVTRFRYINNGTIENSPTIPISHCSPIISADTSSRFKRVEGAPHLYDPVGQNYNYETTSLAIYGPVGHSFAASLNTCELQDYTYPFSGPSKATGWSSERGGMKSKIVKVVLLDDDDYGYTYSDVLVPAGREDEVEPPCYLGMQESDFSIGKGIFAYSATGVPFPSPATAIPPVPLFSSHLDFCTEGFGFWAYAKPGYRILDLGNGYTPCGGMDNHLYYHHDGENLGVEVEKLKEYTLTVNTISDANPALAPGFFRYDYVGQSLNKAMKYYVPDVLSQPNCHEQEKSVRIQAVANPGFTFERWSGNAQIWSNNDLVDIDSQTDNDVVIKMSNDVEVTAIFKRKPIFVAVLSGEQPHIDNAWPFGDPDPDRPGPLTIEDDGECELSDSSDRPANACSGLFTWADSLKSDPRLLVKKYNEDDVSPTGAGQVLSDIEQLLSEGKVDDIILVGHSHGGGSVADLCALLESKKLNNQLVNGERLNVLLTAYVDAIRNDTDMIPFAETGRPALSNYHVNIYTQIPSIMLSVGFHGVSIPASDINIDINSFECVSCVHHGFIDNCVVTHRILTREVVNLFCGGSTSQNFCDDVECVRNKDAVGDPVGPFDDFGVLKELCHIDSF